MILVCRQKDGSKGTRSSLKELKKGASRTKNVVGGRMRAAFAKASRHFFIVPLASLEGT